MLAVTEMTAKFTELRIFLQTLRLRFFRAFGKHFGSHKWRPAVGKELSRFIFSQKQYGSGMAKPGAFLPAKDKFVISMCWIDLLGEAAIWSMGDFVGQNRGKRALARADLGATTVTSLKLSLLDTPAFHPRHVDVAGWPLGKDEQKSIALDLCAKSKLSIR
jgi:hypothetical protein